MPKRATTTKPSRAKQRPSKPRSATRKRGTPARLVRAHAIVSSGRETAVAGADDVARARRTFVAEAAPADAAERASKALEKLGFKIVGRGAASLTIEGPPSLFEKVFSTSLSQERARPSAGAENATFPRQGWRFGRAPKVPENLRDLIAGVAVPAAKTILR